MLRSLRFLIIVLCLCPQVMTAQVESEQQLASLAHLIGGKWWSGSDTYLQFEWGLGRSQIKMRRVVVSEEQETPVSEGFFYYSPDAFSIKGISTLQVNNETPVLFEYFGTVTEHGVEFIIRSIATDSSVQLYSEVWVKTSENHYRWTRQSLDEDVPALSGEFVRKN